MPVRRRAPSPASPASTSSSSVSAFRKLGLVYEAAAHQSAWSTHSALTPTPVLHRDGFIRVYAGFRDDAGISRIGYVDLDPQDPTRILRVSRQPALDIGRDGCFDDNGVILGDVVPVERELYLFYVGFQKVAKAKFLAFSGVALSTDGGDSFRRTSEAPIIDRAPHQTTIGAIHTAWHEDGQWRIWYARGNDWQRIDGQDYPRYEICHLRGRDLQALPRSGELCLAPLPPEYRIGRPRVYRRDGGYLMYYTKGTTGGEYFPGRARSADGVHWTREDSRFELELSAQGWDSRHLCYPSLLAVGDRQYMFYNGNDMGRSGFGIAVRDLPHGD